MEDFKNGGKESKAINYSIVHQAFLNLKNDFSRLGQQLDINEHPINFNPVYNEIVESYNIIYDYHTQLVNFAELKPELENFFAIAKKFSQIPVTTKLKEIFQSEIQRIAKLCFDCGLITSSQFKLNAEPTSIAPSTSSTSSSASSSHSMSYFFSSNSSSSTSSMSDIARDSLPKEEEKDRKKKKRGHEKVEQQVAEVQKKIMKLKLEEKDKKMPPTNFAPLFRDPSSSAQVVDRKLPDNKPYRINQLVYHAQMLLRTEHHAKAASILLQLRLADKNNPLVHLLLAFCYSNQFYLRANQSEFTSSLKEYLKIIAENKERKKSTFSSAAEQFFQEGIMSYYGPPDKEKKYLKIAAQCFEKSANLGYLPAQFNLALCYDRGEGVEKNTELARKWFTSAKDKLSEYIYDDYSDIILEKLPSFLPTALDEFDKKIKDFRVALRQRQTQSESQLKSTYDSAIEQLQIFNSFPLLCLPFLKLLESIAEQGHVPSLLKLAELYLNRLPYSPGDAEKRYRWLANAAILGSEVAQFQLGKILERETSVIPNNLDKAISFFYLSAIQGNKDAQFWLATKYHRSHSKQPAHLPLMVFWYEKAAEQNHFPAARVAAQCYYYGEGVEKDFKKSIEFAMRITNPGEGYYDLDFRDAQFLLGLCYQLGKGTQLNLDKAIECYEHAADYYRADLLMARATYREGLCLETQGKLESAGKVFVKAARYYELLLRNVKEEDKFDMHKDFFGWGRCCEKIIFLNLKNSPIYKKDAIYAYGTAAQATYPQAHFRCALLLETSQISDELSLAFYYYQQAANLGHREAQLKLAEHYEIDKDEEQAKHWYEKAQGNQRQLNEEDIDDDLSRLSISNHEEIDDGLSRLYISDEKKSITPPRSGAINSIDPTRAAATAIITSGQFPPPSTSATQSSTTTPQPETQPPAHRPGK